RPCSSCTVSFFVASYFLLSPPVILTLSLHDALPICGAAGGELLGTGAGGEVVLHRGAHRRRRLDVAQMVQQQGDREHRGGGIGEVPAGDVRSGAVNRLEHRREGAGGIDVAARGEPDAAADGRGEVGDDVAEEVVRDDHVEAGRVLDQVDHHRVDVRVVHLDLGVLGADLLDDAAVEVPGVDQDVVLVDQGELPAAPLGLL